MARGFSWCNYVDDEGTTWSLQVDSDYLLDPARGWVAVGSPPAPTLPRGWRARRVVGLDSQGAKIFAISGTTTSAIWTMSDTSFTFEANDGTTQSAIIIGRQAERRRPRPPEL